LVLAERGFVEPERLTTYLQLNSELQGHPDRTPGIEISSGPLGMGLSVATGMALAARLDALDCRIFALLSDGECDAGSTWETILFAPQYKLDNLIAIVDYNKIQSLGRVKEVIDLDPLSDKWRAFGWAVREIDGHNLNAIEQALTTIPYELNRPNCIIAHTIKGKGVSFMENNADFHGKAPNAAEVKLALKELE
jgi:transketolase